MYWKEGEGREGGGEERGVREEGRREGRKRGLMVASSSFRYLRYCRTTISNKLDPNLVWE